MINTTIVAQATAMVAQPIGIIRLSGPQSLGIAKIITKKERIQVRTAHFVQLYEKQVIDHAVVLYFKAPYSFTGEDVVEIQMHGNPYLMERVIALCLEHGACMAQPGEFSKRAFLNGKMSLDQVEAVADLIHANSFKAAKSAALSLDGALKQQIELLQSELMALRVLIEASIDFSEDDIPTISEQALAERIVVLQKKIQRLLASASQGAVLQKGIKVSLVGEPNVGKSTLMNAVCQKDVSIVTNEAGTTRDIVCREVIHKGVCLTFSDTAGIRETESKAEAMGIERSYQAIEDSDLVLHIKDSTEVTIAHKSTCPIWTVINKVDLLRDKTKPCNTFMISAKHNLGVAELLDAILEYFKLGDVTEAPFSARARQVDVLKRVEEVVSNVSAEMPYEILASDLRVLQDVLSEITGDVSNDDVLAELFAGFCIGK